MKIFYLCFLLFCAGAGTFAVRSLIHPTRRDFVELILLAVFLTPTVISGQASGLAAAGFTLAGIILLFITSAVKYCREFKKQQSATCDYKKYKWKAAGMLVAGISFQILVFLRELWASC